MSATGPSPSTSTTWHRVVIWAGIPLVIGALNEFALHVSAPVVREEFGLEVTRSGWMLVAFFLADGAVLILAGRLGDRIGRRRIAILGLAVAALGSLVCAGSPSFGALLVGRIIEGLGVGALFSGLLAIIVDAVPPPSRGRAFGIWALIGAIAVIASPLVGGLLAEHVSWRWIFVINIVISIAALVTARRYVPDHPRRAAGPRPRVGHLLKAPQFGAGTAVMTLLYAALSLVWLLLVFFLTVVSGFGPATVGVMFVAYAVWWLVLPPFTGRLADRVGVRKPMLLGTALAVVGLATLAVAAGSRNGLVIAVGLSLLGIGVAFTIPATNAATMAHVPAEIRGDASGVNMTLRIVGTVVGLAVSTVLLNSLEPGDVATSARIGWITSGVLMLVALVVVALRIRPRSIAG